LKEGTDRAQSESHSSLIDHRILSSFARLNAQGDDVLKFQLPSEVISVRRVSGSVRDSSFEDRGSSFETYESKSSETTKSSHPDHNSEGDVQSPKMIAVELKIKHSDILSRATRGQNKSKTPL
jgi:hypothetical protein